MALIAVVLLVAAVRFVPIEDWLGGAERWVDAHPLAGSAAYIAATIATGILMTPGWIPMMLAGLLFGVGQGIVYGTIGITLGATAGMLIGRTLARPWVERYIRGNETLLALDDALDRQAFTIVMLTRLAFIIPFNVLNYAYGATRVKIGTYAAATAVGMLPIVAMYAYLGSLAGDVGELLSGETRPAGQTWWVAGIALVVIAIVVLIVRRAVRRALEERTQTGAERDSRED